MSLVQTDCIKSLCGLSEGPNGSLSVCQSLPITGRQLSKESNNESINTHR